MNMKRVLCLTSIVALAACVPAAVAPATELGACEANLADKGLSFVDFIAESVIDCGADMLALVDSLLASSDPKYAKYKADALAAKRDPARMDALKAHVAAARAAAKK